MADLTRRLRILAALVVVIVVAWFALVVVGLAGGGYTTVPVGPTVAGYGLVLLLSLAVLVLRTPCACSVPKDRLPLPSAEGLAAGAVAFALGAVVLGAVAIPALRVPAATQVALLWVVGVLIGGLASVAMIAGLLVCRHRHEDESPRPEEETVPVPDDAWRRPDPWMYSQDYARALGEPVTWDNPSVTIYDAGTNMEVPPDDLRAGADYRFFVEVQNGTPVTPAPVAAVGTQLSIRLRQFGIGGGTVDWVVPPSSAITVPDIPRTPRGPGDPPSAQVVTHDWTAPADPGHYCMIFELDHPDDSNTMNNVGQHNLDVEEAQPGQTMSVALPIWNRPAGEGAAGPPVGGRRTASIADVGGIAGSGLDLAKRGLSPLFWVWSLPFRFLHDRRTADWKDHEADVEPPDLRRIELEVEDGTPGREIQPSGWNAVLDRTVVDLDPLSHDRPVSPEATATLDVDVPPSAQAGDVAAFHVTATRADGVVGGVTVIVRVVGP